MIFSFDDVLNEVFLNQIISRISPGRIIGIFNTKCDWVIVERILNAYCLLFDDRYSIIFLESSDG